MEQRKVSLEELIEEVMLGGGKASLEGLASLSATSGLKQRCRRTATPENEDISTY